MEDMDAELHELEFYFNDIQRALTEQGLTSFVEQTGGGTATITIQNEATHERVLMGPGAYNWMSSGFSIFGTYELSIGEDAWGLDDEYKDAEPEEVRVPEGSTLEQIVALAKKTYDGINVK